MTTLIDFLDEIEQSRQTVVIAAVDVDRLAARFGPVVRSMGYWNKTGDGSIEVPMENVMEAVRALGGSSLGGAISQLRSSAGLANAIDSSSAKRLIEALSSLYLRHFQDRVERFQNAAEPADAERLWSGIARDLFGE